MPYMYGIAWSAEEGIRKRSYKRSSLARGLMGKTGKFAKKENFGHLQPTSFIRSFPKEEGYGPKNNRNLFHGKNLEKDLQKIAKHLDILPL